MYIFLNVPSVICLFSEMKQSIIVACRLLDVCTRRQTVRETQLMLVFEYVDQDLDMFLKNAPEEGIPAPKIKVQLHSVKTVNVC